MNRLPINQMFKENAQGTLLARFRNDDLEIYSESADGGRIFVIDLFYCPDRFTANPIEDVTFYLDGPLRDRIRLARKNNDGTYEATIQAGGDFVITSEVTIAGRPFRQQIWLSDMLETGYSDQFPSQAIREAIQQIRDN